MEYSRMLNEYGPAATAQQVAALVDKARTDATRNHNTEVYKLCYSTIDLTQLNVTDSVSHITSFTQKVMEFGRSFPAVPNVASICVYPVFVETVALAIGDGNMAITSVGGGFPSSQTFAEVKMLEIAMAIENGADEIDIVINAGQLLDGQYDQLASEIELLHREMGEGTTLKVIIESGALKTPELIRKASLLAMFAGADFVKTSTGKIDIAATPEAAMVMCQAIRDYYTRTGRKVGFKAAGGVKTAEDAALYYTIVEDVLGPEWLTPALFRIGASSAANNILGSITGKEIKYF
ncbi:deoxyribose-phosphate aldolase [Bacteroidia bacterium]|nr:deoxyribose-phosphate aldolase [Bacteroidia bacterium]